MRHGLPQGHPAAVDHRDEQGVAAGHPQGAPLIRPPAAGSQPGRSAFARYAAVRLPAARATSLGVPVATIRPPPSPPPGPMSTTRSAPATTVMSCSTTTTEF